MSSCFYNLHSPFPPCALALFPLYPFAKCFFPCSQVRKKHTRAALSPSLFQRLDLRTGAHSQDYLSSYSRAFAFRESPFMCTALNSIGWAAVALFFRYSLFFFYLFLLLPSLSFARLLFPLTCSAFYPPLSPKESFDSPHGHVSHKRLPRSHFLSSQLGRR